MLNMVAGSRAKMSDEEAARNTHRVELAGSKPIRVLKSAVLFGANASGKSNVISAFKRMRDLVVDSATRIEPNEKLPIVPFLLDSETPHTPSEFEVQVVIDGVRYQYGFMADRDAILAEWLYAWPKGSRQLWFERFVNSVDPDEWKYGALVPDSSSLKEISKKTRENVLFLAAAAQWNHEHLGRVWSWFDQSLPLKALNSGPGLDQQIALRLVDDIEFRNFVIGCLQKADCGILEIMAEKLPVDEARFQFPPDMPTELKRKFLQSLTDQGLVDVQIRHTAANEQGYADLDFGQESDGTKKLLILLGTWYDVVLCGRVMLVDELSASMHPLLTRMLISMFHGELSTQSGSQIILTTHDTTLLDQELFGRDQIWFTEKDSSGATSLVSLYDYRPRKNEALQRGYLSGRYGGIPILEGFDPA
ncbi:MAG: ATP-binding protein [Planctomycetes bacterium]|nr:ATP-binding protein [Planctomycetota bacterium]